MSMRLFLHAVRMIANNFADAARLTLLIAVLGQLLVMYFGRGLFETQTDMPRGDDLATLPPVDPALMLNYALALLAQSFLASWAAVVWHRFVLLQEYPEGVVPPFRFDLILGYFGRFVLVSIVLVLAILPLSILLMFFAIALGALGVTLAAVVLGVVSIWLSLRISLILPAAAIGERLTLKESWQQTAPFSSDIFGLAVIMVLLSIPSLILGSIFAGLTILEFVVAALIGWLTILIGASVLTTLYGVVIEKRELT